jgi:hypothetical protein
MSFDHPKNQNKSAIEIDRLILDYTHEKRLVSYKRDIHQIWNSNFADTPVHDVKVVVDHRNNRTLQNELVQKRPKSSLLSIPTKQKYSFYSILYHNIGPFAFKFRESKSH